MGITTDLIVGFPGESENDFEQTLSLCREVEFDNAFVFKYSPRKGTPAAAMPDLVSQSIIEERHARLLKVIDEIATRKCQAFLGKEVDILVEGPSRKNRARLEGRTRCNRIVVFDGSPRQVGHQLRVRVERTGLFTLYGDAALNLD